MSMSIASALCAGVYGRLARSIDWRRIFIFSFFLLGLGLVVIATGHGFVSYLVGCIIAGMGIGWICANAMTAGAQEAGTAFQSRVTGVLKGALYFGQPAVVLLINPIGERFGPRGVFGVGSAVSLVVLSYFVFTLAARTLVGKPKPAT